MKINTLLKTATLADLSQRGSISFDVYDTNIEVIRLKTLLTYHQA